MKQDGNTRTAETRQAAKRLEYIDIAKGIGIFLVVIGHCFDSKSLLGLYIYSFHMPLFFFLSGLCFNDAKYTEFLPLLKRRVRTLLLPLIYFCAINLFLNYIVGDDIYTIDDLFNGKFSNALWFIYVLFLSELLYWFVTRAFCKTGIKIAVLLVSLVVGVALDRFDASLPFSMCTVFAATFFYGMGNICRGDPSGRLARIPVWGGGILLVIPLISAFCIHVHLDMRDNSIPSPVIWTCMLALFGTMGTLIVSNVLTKADSRIKNIILYIGRNTLAILGLHVFFIRLSWHYVEPLIPSYIASKGVEQIFVWLMLVICIRLINTYVPWLVGKTKAKA